MTIEVTKHQLNNIITALVAYRQQHFKEFKEETPTTAFLQGLIDNLAEQRQIEAYTCPKCKVKISDYEIEHGHTCHQNTGIDNQH